MSTSSNLFSRRLVASLAAILLFGALLAYFGIGLVETGAFRSVVPRFRGDCRPISPVMGSEDVEYSKTFKTFFISAGNFPEGERLPETSGTIYALNEDGSDLRSVADVPWIKFHPHGMSLLEIDGETLLWVINHSETETTVELFKYDGKKLEHLKTFADEHLANANDVAALSREKFFVTRDHQSVSPAAARLKDYIRYGDGAVVSFDGKSYETRADGLAFANGIVLSPDRSKLVVAEMLRQRLHVFKIEDSEGHLSDVKTVTVPGSPDNLSWDDDAALWVGAHPNLLRLRSHAKYHSVPAPSEVLRVRGVFDDVPRVDSVLTDDGTHMSAASVALRVDDHLVVGSVYDSKFLYCKIIPD